MSESPNKQKKYRMEMLYFVCFWFCISVLFLVLYISGLAPIKRNELGDSDCYMRLIRVSELYHTGKWYDPVIQRSNAPYGESSHWTRPFDVLLLAGAVPLGLFTDFESALFWWGIVISPLLLIAAIVSLQWSTRAVLKGDGPFLVGFMFVFQVIILTYFQPGRPDHHSLIILLFVLSIGFALRMIQKPFSLLLCCAAGAVGALSVWVSVESMLTICVIMAGLCLLWILKNGDFLQKSLHYSLALFVFTALSLVLERPWHDLTTQQFDRLSIVQCGVLGYITVFWIISSIFSRNRSLYQTMSYRFSFFLAGAAAIALLTLLSFPKFYKGPMADVDPEIIPIWLNKVGEVQPLLSGSNFVIPIQLFGSAFLCLVFLCYLILKDKRDEDRNAWIFISLAAAIYFVISFYQIRWAAYAQSLLIIPMAALMLLLRQRGPKAGFLKTLKNVFIVLSFSLGFLFIGLLADVIFKKGDAEKSRHKVSLIRMCENLNDEKWRKRSFRILTHIDFGAEILYRTRHEVIGTPYHRNSSGILDTIEIMTADTDKTAYDVIQKRGIDLILLCPKSTDKAFFSKPEQTSAFYQKLLGGKVPNWLRKVELPSDLTSSFLLFRTAE